MTLNEGYRVMFYFLDAYFWNNKTDELGNLLSSMSLLNDDEPADLAIKEDWETAVSQITGKAKNQVLSDSIAFYAMIRFLHNWCDIGTDGSMRSVCNDLESLGHVCKGWQDAIKTVLSKTDDPYLST